MFVALDAVSVVARAVAARDTPAADVVLLIVRAFVALRATAFVVAARDVRADVAATVRDVGVALRVTVCDAAARDVVVGDAVRETVFCELREILLLRCETDCDCVFCIRGFVVARATTVAPPVLPPESLRLIEFGPRTAASACITQTQHIMIISQTFLIPLVIHILY